MKHIKIFEEFVYANVVSDDEIADELRKMFKGSDFEKTGLVEQRIKQLLVLHNKWIEMGKKLYDKSDIARRLYQYQRNLNK